MSDTQQPRCETCGGPVSPSELQPEKLFHVNPSDWLLKAAGGAHPVRVREVPDDARTGE